VKRRKLLRIELAHSADEVRQNIENPECQLYCLVFVLASESLNRRADNAAEVLRNVAVYMDNRVDEYECNKFVASCLSFSGFGMDSRVDIAGKLGHMERLCEAVYKSLGLDLPERSDKEGYPPLTAAWHEIPRDGRPVEIPVVECSLDEYKPSAPWVKGRIKVGGK